MIWTTYCVAPVAGSAAGRRLESASHQSKAEQGQQPRTSAASLGDAGRLKYTLTCTSMSVDLAFATHNFPFSPPSNHVPSCRHILSRGTALSVVSAPQTPSPYLTSKQSESSCLLPTTSHQRRPQSPPPASPPTNDNTLLLPHQAYTKYRQLRDCYGYHVSTYPPRPSHGPLHHSPAESRSCEALSSEQQHCVRKTAGGWARSTCSGTLSCWCAAHGY